MARLPIITVCHSGPVKDLHMRQDFKFIEFFITTLKPARANARARYMYWCAHSRVPS